MCIRDSGIICGARACHIASAACYSSRASAAIRDALLAVHRGRRVCSTLASRGSAIGDPASLRSRALQHSHRRVHAQSCAESARGARVE
eukprot:6129170-Alexandrium_andersonii.AAC.1